MIINWRWFISKSLRDAREERKQVGKLLSAQQDLLKTASTEEIRKALQQLDSQSEGKLDPKELKSSRESLLAIAERNLFPYPDAKYRDWVEMFLVVATLVLTFRSFFFQPFKIPTGSMQPTLYGITAIDNNTHESETTLRKSENGILTTDTEFFLPEDEGRIIHLVKDQKKSRILNFISKNEVQIDYKGNPPPQPLRLEAVSPPSISRRIINKLKGLSYHSLVAEGNWTLITIDPPKTIFPLISKQKFKFTDESGNVVQKTVWFPPIRGDEPLLKMPGFYQIPEYGGPPRPYIREYDFKKGDYVFNLELKTGDHLFVNRMTYNFRRPRRGDIAVFTISQNTIPSRSTDAPVNETFYIKRLAALGGEKILLGRDRHLTIDGQRLDTNNPGFEFLYSHQKIIKLANGQIIRSHLKEAEDSIYSGHTEYSKLRYDLPITVTPNHYYMLGDNSINSRDSRAWGELPQKNVIGHSSIVYWPPLSPRFGWSHR